MCIFNRAVAEVKGTKILVGRIKDGRQLTVYENQVAMDASTTSNAMILPCPFNGKEKIDLVDLSSQPGIFAACEAAFPRQRQPQPQSRGMSSPRSSKLEVHQVGSYSISIAESLADLRRIDESVFKVADNVDVILAKHYSEGFGFIICKFNSGEKRHPVGYIHPLLNEEEGTMFVPTLHEHGGDEEAKEADWDHSIFSLCCTEASGPTPEEHQHELEEKHGKDKVTVGNASKFASEYSSLRQRAKGLPKKFVLRRLEKKGKLPNEDTLFKSLSPSTVEKSTGDDEADTDEPAAEGEKEVPKKREKKERCTMN